MKNPLTTPDRIDIYADVMKNPGQRDDLLGTIWDAARVAETRVETIRVWISRGKITPIVVEGEQLFHLPTVKAAAERGRKYTPADPAANSRGHRARQPAA